MQAKKISKYKLIFKRQSIVAIMTLGVVLTGGALASAATTNTVVNVDVNSTIGMSSDGIVNFSIIPTSGGVVSSGSDTVLVTTSDSSGYTLTFSDSDADTALTDIDSNTLVATSGTKASPAALDMNSWGYRVDNTIDFGGGVTAQETNASNSAYTWAGVPGSSSPETIKITESTATNDQTNFWYAVRADQTKPSGIYSGIVTYTATANE